MTTLSGKLLDELMPELSGMLDDEARWQSMDIDYHPPRVHRLWTSWRGEFRVNIHRLFPCGPGEALYHPHPWPSVVHVFNVVEKYVMGVGQSASSDDVTPPPICVTTCAGRGSTFSYEMLDPCTWHTVRPSEGAMSIMLTGRPWKRPMPVTPSGPLKPLDDEDRADLIRLTKAYLWRERIGG